MAYPGSSSQKRSQCSTRISAGADVGRGSLKKPAIACLTLGLSREWSYPEGLILPIVTLGTIRPEDSGAAQNASFSIKLHRENSSLRLSGGISPRRANNPYRASEG